MAAIRDTEDDHVNGLLLGVLKDHRGGVSGHQERRDALAPAAALFHNAFELAFGSGSQYRIVDITDIRRNIVEDWLERVDDNQLGMAALRERGRVIERLQRTG